MRTDAPPLIRLADYRPPDFLIDTVDLDISLDLTATRVTSRLTLRRNPAGRADAPLVLDGDELHPVSVRLDGVTLDLASGLATPQKLTIDAPFAKPFTLEIETLLNPQANTKLMGLYRSGSAFCTQCEAEGFRRITYFLDRPDVLSVYTVRLEADRTQAPVLLGNGNPRARGSVPGTGRHFAIWHDPHPKPCYLFALVGGRLDAIHDSLVTASGRKVALGIYVEPGKADRAHYAMDALKRSMRWDEQAFGREYDLDVFNIVAVSDFNMGAMENKGLNIFNDKYVLALPQTATDQDYLHIEAIIAHEYFHNWTGNRITCRDWFQLCLKEGLTVFRDQEFTADERSRPVKRIADVRNLRAGQFVEDAGPLAHNVRPDAYAEINNFYTSTVYEKGAEVIRMLKLLIGADRFRQGMDLYFRRCDGTAATMEDFIACFAQTSGRDLTQFMRWYNQAGTPVVRVRQDYDAAAGALTVELSQHTAPTPRQPDKQPFVIPVALGLVDPEGGAPALHLAPGTPATPQETATGVFELSAPARTLTFTGLKRRPVVSLLRGFSAPVRLDSTLADEGLLTLFRHDPDRFNRWQAAQTYATRLLIRSAGSLRAGGEAQSDAGLTAAFASVLAEAGAAQGALDPALATQLLTLPGEADVARDIGSDIDPDAIYAARRALRHALGEALAEPLLETCARLNEPAGLAYSPDAQSAGRRALRNCALDLACASGNPAAFSLAQQQFSAATSMTDELAALSVLAYGGGAAGQTALHHFYARHKDDPLIIDKWFALQACVPAAETLGVVRQLMAHAAFSLANPNRVRALVGSFAMANMTQFNRRDGQGYRLLAEVVCGLDASNPQVAARLLGALRSWRMLEAGRRAHAQDSLQTVARAASSPDVTDIVTRMLA